MSLVVTSGLGCLDTTTKKVRVYGDPKRPNITNSTVKNDKNIRIKWKLGNTDIPGEYVLERANGKTNRFEVIANLNNDQQAYLDRDLMVDSLNYIYRLKKRDSCGNESPYSNPVTSPVKLSADEGDGNPKLNWTEFIGWDISHYEVQAQNKQTGQFNTVSGYEKVSPNRRNLIDSVTETGFKRNCYRIVTHKAADSSIQSISNVNCIDPTMRIFIPNAFTPDGNGINDKFVVKGTYVVDYSIKIFNRWGEKVFESDSMEESWDGLYKGEKAPAGVYIYTIQAEGANGALKKEKGQIKLIR